MSLKYLRKIQFYISLNKETHLTFKSGFSLKAIQKIYIVLIKQISFIFLFDYFKVSFCFSFKPLCVSHYQTNLSIFFCNTVCIDSYLIHCIYINTFFFIAYPPSLLRSIGKIEFINKDAFLANINDLCLYSLLFFKLIDF